MINRMKIGANHVRLLGAAVSVVTLAAVIWWALKQGDPRLPSASPQIAALLGAIAVYAVATALRAERWLLLLRRSGASASRLDCYGLTTVGYMGNNVLPVRGGDVLRVYLMAPRARTGKRTVIGTLVAERVLDVAVLFALFLVLAYGILHGIDPPHGTGLLVVLGVLGILAVGAALAVPLIRRRGVLVRARDFLRPMVASTLALFSASGLGLGLMTVLIWACEASTYWAVGQAAQVDLGPLQSLYLVAVAGLLVIIPAGPGNAGTLDAGVILAVKALKHSGTAALSYLLLLRFVLLAPITAVGLIVLFVRYGGWSALVRGRRSVGDRGEARAAPEGGAA
jgi:uncharacterized membrane protein YbhN (UPF0104 family)